MPISLEVWGDYALFTDANYAGSSTVWSVTR